MTKQIERIVNAETGEVTERELTQAEIDANAAINSLASPMTSKPSIPNEA